MIHDRVDQCTLSSIYKFYANNAPDYMKEIFPHGQCNWIPTSCFLQKLKLPHHKTNQDLRALSYIGPSLRNNLKKSLKTCTSSNSFKHNLNDYCLKKSIKKSEKW